MGALLSDLYSGSSFPVWSAILLGLMTAISPCPLATNITALGFISKDLEVRKRVFYNGLFYTLGRAFSYTGLAFILYVGADQLKVSFIFQKYGERFLGPLMIVIGIFMLGLIHFNIPGMDKITNRFKNKTKHSYFDVFLLGLVFALAFCPYSGVLYFGMLMPLTLESSYGLLLPVLFALATGIPVIIFSWLLAYTISGVGRLYDRIKTFEFWFRRIVAFVFIGFGIYYTILIWF
jgi:cytochrome c-type biogenesis protein